MYPKQFILLCSESGQSLLASTLHRLSLATGFAAPILLSHNDHRFLLSDELARVGVESREILLEPMARNTAPAIVVAALSIAEQDPEGVLAVMPSDHVIDDANAFAQAISRARDVAGRDRLMLFGIKPATAHTGYGYIRQGQALNGAEDSAFLVEAFVEKPDLATAESYLCDGSYYWNSGIFILPVVAFLEEVEHLAPEILEAARAALEGGECDLGFRRLDASAYAQAPNISVDHAIMEKTTKAAVMPLDLGWSDVGSWSSVWEQNAQDEDGNVAEGDTMLVDTRNSYVRAHDALVSTIGVEDTVIVHTPDATLVAKKDRAQDVSALVAQLKRSNRGEHQQHVCNHRPWGFFETLNLGSRFQVKLLHVKPGGRLSLQMHHHRSEHWVVVTGTALVTCNGEEKLVCENESVYISAPHWHRQEKPGKVPMEKIEVQIGSYLGEDDIIRSDDAYRRAPHETK
jgi:mannose-1-phosphate guanylyltransferase/mannose-6-phosphate isomerase